MHILFKALFRDVLQGSLQENTRSHDNGDGEEGDNPKGSADKENNGHENEEEGQVHKGHEGCGAKEIAQ